MPEPPGSPGSPGSPDSPDSPGSPGAPARAPSLPPRLAGAWKAAPWAAAALTAATPPLAHLALRGALSRGAGPLVFASALGAAASLGVGLVSVRQRSAAGAFAVALVGSGLGGAALLLALAGGFPASLEATCRGCGLSPGQMAAAGLVLGAFHGLLVGPALSAASLLRRRPSRAALYLLLAGLALGLGALCASLLIFAPRGGARLALQAGAAAGAALALAPVVALARLALHRGADA
jgi:hypothetical protein